MVSSVISRPLQKDFLSIPQSPLCYWLRPRFFELLSGKTLGDVAAVVQGLATANDPRFVRFVCEVPPEQHGQPVRERRWVPFEKGGGYGKWFGHHWWMVDWESDGARLKSFPASVIRNEQYYFKKGWTYSDFARGSFGPRKMVNSVFSTQSPAAITDNQTSLGLIFACRTTSQIIRSISAQINHLRESYVKRLPMVSFSDVSFVKALENTCIALKRVIVAHNITERSSNPISLFSDQIVQSDIAICAVLHMLEGVAERVIFQTYKLDEEDTEAVIQETGTPCGWFPLVKGYGNLPELTEDLPKLPHEALEILSRHERITASSQEMNNMKQCLFELYKAGPGFSVIEDEFSETSADGEDKETSAGARIPIPTETFLEELSQKMKIHPISIYRLLKEGIEEHAWRCLPEEKRILEDRFTVLVLQLLGHRWPVQIERAEPVPEWADQDGIIPLTEGCGEKTLLERIRERIVHEFPAETVTRIERSFAEVVGKPLHAWLSGDFFKRHISQFRKRPIAWQIQSKPLSKGLKGQKKSPAFSCLIYYHKLDADIIHKIRSQYVGPLITRYETEFRTLQGSDSESNDVVGRKYQLENWIEELMSFDEELERLTQDGFNTEKLRKTIAGQLLDKWNSSDGQKSPPGDTDSFYNQEKTYFPDINDGVRVNIAPLQRAGLLALNVLSKKDVAKAIENRAEWRADERRWCREGKLTKPGWWD